MTGKTDNKEIELEEKQDDLPEDNENKKKDGPLERKIIKKIVGHRGQGVTENVYTHFEVQELIDAINQI